jgi:hypothetical protein
MSEYTKIEKDLYSKEKSAQTTFDQTDIENYIDKVEKNYHKRRKEMWWDSYKINYRNRHPKQKEMRKAELD